MFISQFPQALNINPCPRKIVCNTCEVIYMLGGMFNSGENVVDED